MRVKESFLQLWDFIESYYMKCAKCVQFISPISPEPRCTVYLVTHTGTVKVGHVERREDPHSCSIKPWIYEQKQTERKILKIRDHEGSKATNEVAIKLGSNTKNTILKARRNTGNTTNQESAEHRVTVIQGKHEPTRN